MAVADSDLKSAGNPMHRRDFLSAAGSLAALAPTARTVLAGEDRLPKKVVVPDWVVYPGKDWQTITPAEAGLDVDKWNAWVARQNPSGNDRWGQNSQRDFGVVVTRGGYLLKVFGNAECKVQCASVGKAFTSFALQLAIDEGLISPRDFARLGWLWLNHGRWGEDDVLPASLFDACIRPGVPADLPRTKGKDADYLDLGSYGGGTDQTPYGPGVYGFNFWFNQSHTDEQPLVWPALPADTYQANGMWNRDTVTVIPSLRMVVAVRGAKLGPFEPGKADGAANQNLKLLVETAPQADGSGEKTSVGWQKCENNPVLGDSFGTYFDVALLRDSNRYRMWFSWRPKESVALTESVDGVRWNEPTIVLEPRDGVSGWESHPANPIISPGRNQWDHDACYKPFAIFDEDKSRWLLWYNGRRGRTEQIGLAIHPGGDLGFAADRNGG